MTERKKFIIEAQGGLFSHAELCRRHSISRQKGYKWLERYKVDGPDGLLSPSSTPTGRSLHDRSSTSTWPEKASS